MSIAGTNKRLLTDVTGQALVDAIMGLTPPPVDDAMSDQSVNPVQNKVIYNELNQLSQRIGSVESPAQTAIKLSFSIAVADWQGSGPYTYTFTSSSITANSLILEPMISSGFDELQSSWSWTPTASGVIFSVNTKPTAVVSGSIPVVDSVNGTVPVERGGTGATTAVDARVNLGFPAHGVVIVTGTKTASDTLVIDNTNITADHQMVNYFLGTPTAEPASWTWTTSAGHVSIEGTFNASTTITLILAVPY